MTLGEIVSLYRREKNISQRQFAEKCGLSNGYISMVESGINPKTNQPIAPALKQIKKLAIGMGISVHDLIDTADDIDIELSFPSSLGRANCESSEISREIDSIYDALNIAGQKELCRYGRYLAEQPEYKADGAAPLTVTQKDNVTDFHSKIHVLRVAGRDGSFKELHLTDEQMKELQAQLDQLPDAPDYL